MWRIFLIAAVVALGLPFLASAQTPTGSQCASLSADEIKKLTGNSPTVFTPDISFPGFTAGTQVYISSNSIADYIRAVFIVFVWVVGVLAVVMIIYGGIKWVAAAGNASQINDAKDVITNSVIGLIIGLTSVLLLQIINPELTQLQGLNLQPVSRCTLALLSQAISQAGSVDKCATSTAGGEPNQVCYEDASKPCVNDFNGLIAKAANYQRADGTRISVDPITLKSIVKKESLSRGVNPLSGPAKVKACPGDSARCKLLSTSYGLGQPIYDTLKRHWLMVEGSMPSECLGDETNYRDLTTGSLKTACSSLLDKDILLQLKIVASVMYEAAHSSCNNGSPTMIAAAYHLGGGDAKKFCSGETPVAESTDVVAGYLRQFNAIYHQVCADSAMAQYEQRAGTGRE